MRRIILVICIILMTALPVHAAEVTAPQVPDSGAKYMPEDSESFAEGMWSILKAGISALTPSLAEACRVCFSVICAGIGLSLFQGFSGNVKVGVSLATALLIGILLLGTGNTMVSLAADTIHELSEYAKLLLPVMAGALAAQGGATTSAALYTATALFSSILSRLIAAVLIPVAYIFLALSVASSASGNDMLGKLKDLVMRLCSWSLKTLLAVFTGFLSITGVVSGTTDAAAAKLTRAAISGMVPVVGGILSEATESVLVGAGMVKNAAGVYGMLAAAAVCIGPFLQIGVQYLLLKATGAFCSLFAGKQVSGLVLDFSACFGLLLGMTGATILLLTISIICFMKGMV